MKKTTIGERIKQARESAGLTQRQLADRLGIRASGFQRISGWETGLRTPSRKNAEKLAEVLGVTAVWILYGDQPQGAATTTKALSERIPRNFSGWLEADRMLIRVDDGVVRLGIWEDGQRVWPYRQDPPPSSRYTSVEGMTVAQYKRSRDKIFWK